MVLRTSFLLKKWLECSTDNESNWLSSAPHRYVLYSLPFVLFLLYTPYWIPWYTFAQWQKWLLWSNPHLIKRNKYKNDLLWKISLSQKCVDKDYRKNFFTSSTQTVRLISKEKNNKGFFFLKKSSLQSVYS